MPLERVNTIGVARMIREQLRQLGAVNGIEVPKQPHQAPWVVVAAGADVGPGDVRRGLDVPRVSERMQLAEERNGQQTRGSRTEDDGGANPTTLDLPLFLNQRHRVVVNRMRHLMTQRARK